MDTEDEFDIRQYVGILRKNLVLIAGCALGCMAAALAFSYTQPKIYQSDARVEILPQDSSVITSGVMLDQRDSFESQVNTQTRVVALPEVEDAANKRLGATADDVLSVSASGVVNSRLMSISAQSKNPTVARDAANAFTDAYLENRASASLKSISDIAAAVQRRQTEIQQEIDLINARNDKSPEAQNRLAVLQEQEKQLKTQYGQVSAMSVVRTSDVSLFSYASTPTSPISPRPKRNGALALVLGGLLGVGLALLRHRFRNTIETADDLEHASPTVSELGTVPLVKTWPTDGRHVAVSSLELNSATAEAYRRIRTNIEFIGIERDLKTIEIVSSTEREGKSTLAAYLATVFAWSGKKVAIVDTDLRHPSVHEFFGLDNENGLTSALLENKSVESVTTTVNVPGGGEVHVIPGGPIPPNPVELLGGARMESFIGKVKKAFDVVIIDTPPIIPVTDPLVVSRYADGLILVVRAGKTTVPQVQEAIELIERSSRAPLVGAVLNGSASEEYKYGYYRPHEVPVPVSDAPADGSTKRTEASEDARTTESVGAK